MKTFLLSGRDKLYLGDDKSEIVFAIYDEFYKGKLMTKQTAMDCFNIMRECDVVIGPGDGEYNYTFDAEKCNPFAMLEWMWKHVGKKVKAVTST